MTVEPVVDAGVVVLALGVIVELVDAGVVVDTTGQEPFAHVDPVVLPPLVPLPLLPLSVLFALGVLVAAGVVVVLPVVPAVEPVVAAPAPLIAAICVDKLLSWLVVFVAILAIWFDTPVIPVARLESPDVNVDARPLTDVTIALTISVVVWPSINAVIASNSFVAVWFPKSSSRFTSSSVVPCCPDCVVIPAVGAVAPAGVTVSPGDS